MIRTATSILDEPASKRLLAGCGVRIPNSAVVPPDAQLAEHLGGLVPPLALKVIAPGVVHKSDLGGVRLNLRDSVAVRDAMHEIRNAFGIRGHSITGFLLEEMAPKGHEMVIGGLNDHRFGPVIMVGLGGIFVEIYADVAFRVCPITAYDAVEMISSLRGAPILNGARGGKPISLRLLVDTLLKIGGSDGLLMKLMPGFRELDVNPLIVSESAAIAVDARIVLV